MRANISLDTKEVNWAQQGLNVSLTGDGGNSLIALAVNLSWHAAEASGCAQTHGYDSCSHSITLWEEPTLCPHPLSTSLSLTLQLVLRRPPLQQGKVADDVLEKDHLGRRHGGGFLRRRAPPQWQMLLAVAPLCWYTAQVFKASHSTHRFYSAEINGTKRVEAPLN